MPRKRATTTMYQQLFDTADLMSEVLQWYSSVAQCDPLYFEALKSTALVCKSAQRAVAVHLTGHRKRLRQHMGELRRAITLRLEPHRTEAADAARAARNDYSALIADLTATAAAARVRTASGQRIREATDAIAQFETQYTRWCTQLVQMGRYLLVRVPTHGTLPGAVDGHGELLGAKVEHALVAAAQALNGLRCDPDRAGWLLASSDDTRGAFATNARMLTALRNECDVCATRCTSSDLARSRKYATCRECMRGPYGMVRMKVRPRHRSSVYDTCFRGSLVNGRAAGAADSECTKNAAALLKQCEADTSMAAAFSQAIRALLARSGRTMMLELESPIVALRLRPLRGGDSDASDTLVGALGKDCPKVRAEALRALETDRRKQRAEAAQRERVRDRARAHLEVFDPLFQRLYGLMYSCDSPLAVHAYELLRLGCDRELCDVDYLVQLMGMSRSGAIVIAAAMEIPDIPTETLRAQRARVSRFFDRVTIATFGRIGTIRLSGGLELFLAVATTFPELEHHPIPTEVACAIMRAAVRLTRHEDHVRINIEGDGWRYTFPLRPTAAQEDLVALGRVLQPHTWATTPAWTLVNHVNVALADGAGNEVLVERLKQCLYERYPLQCGSLYALAATRMLVAPQGRG